MSWRAAVAILMLCVGNPPASIDAQFADTLTVTEIPTLRRVREHKPR